MQGGEFAFEVVVAVVGEHHDPVDVPAAQVGQQALVLLAAGAHEQDELLRGVGQRLGDPADGLRDEGVGEHAGVVLGDDHGQGVGLPGDEAAGGRVGHVPELLDRPAHRLEGDGAHQLAAAHGPGRRGAGHPRHARDVLQRGA